QSLIAAYQALRDARSGGQEKAYARGLAASGLADGGAASPAATASTPAATPASFPLTIAEAASKAKELGQALNGEQLSPTLERIAQKIAAVKTTAADAAPRINELLKGVPAPTDEQGKANVDAVIGGAKRIREEAKKSTEQAHVLVAEFARAGDAARSFETLDR